MRLGGKCCRITCAQIALFPLCQLLFRFFNGTAVSGAEHLRVWDDRGTLIIAPNHINRFDSFLLMGSMPWRFFRSILPLRIMTADMYMRMRGLGKFLQTTGSFTVAEERGVKVLHRAREMLVRGETVVIYPEGRITQPLRGERKGSVGVLWLAREVRNAWILPVRIRGPFRLPIPRLLRGGHNFGVAFGRPYRPASFGENLQPQVNALMEGIYALEEERPFNDDPPPPPPR